MNESQPGEWICPHCGAIHRQQDEATSVCSSCGHTADSAIRVHPAGLDAKAKPTGTRRFAEALGDTLAVAAKVAGGAILIFVGVVVLFLAIAFASCALGR